MLLETSRHVSRRISQKSSRKFVDESFKRRWNIYSRYKNSADLVWRSDISSLSRERATTAQTGALIKISARSQSSHIQKSLLYRNRWMFYSGVWVYAHRVCVAVCSSLALGSRDSSSLHYNIVVWHSWARRVISSAAQADSTRLWTHQSSRDHSEQEYWWRLAAHYVL